MKKFAFLGIFTSLLLYTSTPQAGTLNFEYSTNADNTAMSGSWILQHSDKTTFEDGIVFSGFQTQNSVDRIEYGHTKVFLYPNLDIKKSYPCGFLTVGRVF